MHRVLKRWREHGGERAYSSSDLLAWLPKFRTGYVVQRKRTAIRWDNIMDHTMSCLVRLVLCVNCSHKKCAVLRCDVTARDAVNPIKISKWYKTIKPPADQTRQAGQARKAVPFNCVLVYYIMSGILLDLPTSLSGCIVQSWINVHELTFLDTAHCNRTFRPGFLDLLRSPDVILTD